MNVELNPGERSVEANPSALILRLVQENRGVARDLLKYASHANLQAQLDLSLHGDPATDAQMREEVEKVFGFAIASDHPLSMNQLFSGVDVWAACGDVIRALTNTTNATYEASPVGTLIEEKLVEEVCLRLGFREGDGVMVSGGALANLMAVACARHRADAGFKASGIQGHAKQLVMLVSEEAHYGFIQIAQLIGIGSDRLLRVPADDAGRMRVSELRNAIAGALRLGHHPFFIAATAGTTVKGAFDPIEPIAEVAQAQGIWLHVDGCFGGSVFLSGKHKHLLKGCEQADSFAWDAHKMLSIPLFCSFLLTRERGLLRSVFAIPESAYLFHGLDGNSHDLGEKTLQCSRPVDALKLWLAWKAHGSRRYDERIARYFELAVYAETIVRENPYLELACPRESVAVCFRLKAALFSDRDARLQRLRSQLWQEGQALINIVRVDGLEALRFLSINPRLERSHIDRLFTDISAAIGQPDKSLSPMFGDPK